MPIAPALKAEIRSLIQPYSVPSSVWRMGCCNCCQLTTTGVHKLPFALSSGTHKLAEVVDVLAEKRGDAQVVRTRLAVLVRQLTVVHTGKVQQRVLVVWSVVGLDLVVVGSDAVIPGVDDRLDRVLLVEELLALVQALLASVEVAEEELGVGDGGEGESVSLGCWAGRGGLSRCVLGRLDGVGAGEARVDALEELEREVGLRVLAPNAARNLDKLEGVDLLLDRGDEPAVSESQ